MIYFDFEENRRQQMKKDALKARGKKCTGCICYRLYKNPGRGSCKGFCELKKQRHPDHPRWWGVAQTEVCHEYEEVDPSKRQDEQR